LETKKLKYVSIINFLMKKRVVFTFITAVFLTIIFRWILNRLIYEYSTSIYEVMLANTEPFFSKEAVMSIELLLFLFLLQILIICGLLLRRYRTFAIIFLLLNILSALNAYLVVEVDLIRGL
jgi:hypothetical protein